MASLAIGPFNFMLRYAPVWTHLFVYIVTCLMAATFFYFDYRPVVVFVEYFSGSITPKEYTFQQTAILWSLLLAAPLLFTLGFLGAMQICISPALPLLRRVAGKNDSTVPMWVLLLFFFTSASVGGFDLLRAGAFSKLMVWSDYGAWVEGRWALFSTLGYFSFVNLYLLLPVSAAWLILNIQGNGWEALTKRFIILSIVIALTLLLFQKKALIVSLIIIFGALSLHRILVHGWTHRLAWWLAASIAFIIATYLSMVVLPIYSEASRTADDVLNLQTEKIVNSHKPCEKPGTPESLRTLCREVVYYIGSDRSTHIFAYAALAPMTRTSLPAMYYPIVFPNQHPYYGLDFGQDILGFGGMPDDNQVIWKQMYPNLPGAAGAPYQFALYSQVGVIWALMLCTVVGVVLGIMWNIILVNDINLVWRSLMGSVLILFSIYLAIDSIRGGLLASYGLIWAWLFVSLPFFFFNSLFKPPKP